MNNVLKSSLKTAFCLGIFTFLSLSLIVFVHTSTNDYVKNAANKRLNDQIGKMIPGIEYDNNLVESCTLYRDPVLTESHEYEVYTAFKDGNAVGYVIRSMTLEGYAGAIELLTGVDVDGEIKRVEVLSQSETPGLGDRVLRSNGNWLDQFNNSSLANKKFAVEKDGGDFTYTTGATVTPRAIVNAEKKLLKKLSLGSIVESSHKCKTSSQE